MMAAFWLRRVVATIGIAVLAPLALFLASHVSRDIPERVTMPELTIALATNEYVVLGRGDFMQPKGGTMDERHLAIERRAGGFVAYDVSTSRRVGYYDANDTYRQTDSIELPDGPGMLRIGDTSILYELSGDRLTLLNEDGTPLADLRPEIGRLFNGGREIIKKPENISGIIERLGVYVRGHYQPYTLGGAPRGVRELEQEFKGRAISFAGIPVDSATVVFRSEPSWSEFFKTNGAWYLQRGNQRAGIEVDGTYTDTEARALWLTDLAGQVLIPRIILGNTTFEINPDGDELNLTVLTRGAALEPDEIEPLSDPRLRRATPLADPTAISPARLFWAGSAIAFWAIAILSPTAQWLAPLSGSALPIAVTGAALALFSGQSDSVAIALALCLGLVVLFAAEGLEKAAMGKASFLLFWIVSATFVGTASFLYLNRHNLPEWGFFQRFELAFVGGLVGLMAPFFARNLPLLGGFFWLIFAAIASFGAIPAVRLSLLHPTGAWDDLLWRHLTMMAGFGLAVALVLWIARTRGTMWLNRLLIPNLRFRTKLFVLLVGAAFVVLTLIGSETGIAGVFQPSEVAKFVLVVLVAQTLTSDIARRSMLSVVEGGQSLWWVIYAVAFAGAIFGASLFLYDMSPILVSGVGIFFTLTAGSVLHWVQLRRRRSERLMNGLPIPTNPRLVFDPSSIVFTWQIRRLLKMVVRIWPILVLLCFVLAVSLLSLAVAKNEQFQNGANYSSENTYLLTPWKRLQSYYDVHLSSDRIIDLPETGTQIRMGRENMLEAVCKTPFEELCPMNAASGMAPGAEERLLRLYAVQDDFAAISLIHTFGIDGAILYMSLQAALIVCAMAIGFVVLTAKLDAKLASWMLGCASIGLASIYGAQVLFAWGNVLGFLPVMGQPMTFVSLGASHHFGVGVPFAAIVMLAASLAEPTAAMRDQWRRNMFAHKAVAL